MSAPSLATAIVASTKPAVVAAHHRDRVALLDAEVGQAAGEGVAPSVHLAEGQLAELVDEPDPVGVPDREGDEATRGPVPQRMHGLAEPRQGARPVGPDDAGAAQDHQGRGQVGGAVDQLAQASSRGSCRGGRVRQGSSA